MKFRAIILALLTLCACGCGSSMATVKGKVIESGQPRTFEATQAAVQLTLLGADGQPDNTHSYTAVVNQDGSFEVIASGGELPIGKYQVAIVYRGNDPKYEALYAPGSKLQREIKGGANDLTIDLAKPQD